jgi:hypothetical protein
MNYREIISRWAYLAITLGAKPVLYPELGDVRLEDNAATAVQRFVKSSAVPHV